MALVDRVLPVTAADLELTCDLLDAHPGLSTRDGLHAATMINASIVEIVSADRDFDSIRRIRRVDLGSWEP